jgi:hypothetical protein
MEDIQNKKGGQNECTKVTRQSKKDKNKDDRSIFHSSLSSFLIPHSSYRSSFPYERLTLG